MELRQYQKELSYKGYEILKKLRIVYYAMEVRTGKTLTALETAKLYGSKKVLFLTKKKAINSILSDFKALNYNYELTVVNNESVHLIKDKYDLIISDEHHRNGAFPKPNNATKIIKEKFAYLPMIFLSGTPTPESYSQIYHQFWLSSYTPFKEYVNFYKWAKDYVNVKKKYLGYAEVNDYSDAYQDRIKKITDKFMITFTQEQAGFKTNVIETFLEVEMKPITYNIANSLKKNNLFEGSNDLILADTSVKLMSKLHQIYSGTVILESGKGIVLDNSKLKFINEKFQNNKIAIFYKFQMELEMIKDFYSDKVCFDLETFDATDKNIALQIVSGREGISLKKADYLVYLTPDYSATSYWQSRDRLTTMDRKENNVFWIFAKGGIENYIYKAISNKKNFTKSYFTKYLKLC
jgi:superfamily II DNA or RNA helicase